MCLIALAYCAHPRWPLVLVGNRDEFHARPTAALAEWPGTAIVGGRDLQAGGGWLALSPNGPLAAVTNVREGRAPAGGLASRGGLIPRFLQTGESAPEAAAALMPAAEHYGAFNLLLYDGKALVWAGNRPAPRWQAVSPGVHGLSNATLDSPWPKTLRLQAALRDWLAAGDEDFEPLFAALADETRPPDAALPDTGVGLEAERRLSTAFIRGAAYGTRASSVVCLGPEDIRFEERRFGPDGVALGTTRWAR